MNFFVEKKMILEKNSSKNGIQIQFQSSILDRKCILWRQWYGKIGQTIVQISSRYETVGTVESRFSFARYVKPFYDENQLDTFTRSIALDLFISWYNHCQYFECLRSFIIWGKLMNETPFSIPSKLCLSFRATRLMLVMRLPLIVYSV